MKDQSGFGKTFCIVVFVYISNFYTFFLFPEIEISYGVKMFYHCNVIIGKTLQSKTIKI